MFEESSDPSNMGDASNDFGAAGGFDAMAAGAFTQPADLVVDELWVWPEDPSASYGVELGIQIRNDGQGESGRFTVWSWLDGVALGYEEWDGISPGQKQMKQISTQPLSAGTHTFLVSIGSDANEQNTENNSGQYSFNVKPGPQVVDVEPEVIEVPNIGVGKHGGSADQEIGDFVQHLNDAITDLWDNYNNALGSFIRQLEHSSAQEAEFDADAVLKGAVKGMIDGTVKELVGAAHIPGLSTIIGTIKGGVEAYFAESARSKKAWAEHEFVEYIRKVQRQIEDGRNRMREAAGPQLTEALRSEFDRVSANDPQHGDAQDGRLVGGEGGKFLLELRQTLEGFRQNMPSQDQLEQAIGLAYSAAAAVGSAPNGTLTFHIDLYRLAGGFAPKQTDGAWTINTGNEGKDSRLAESLTKTLGAKWPWELGFRNIVYLSLSADRNDAPWARGEIHFGAEPMQYELTRVEPSNVDTATAQLKEAWERPSTRALMEYKEIIA